MKNNKEVMGAFYNTQGYISLFIILIIFGILIYNLFMSYTVKNEILKHKVDVDIEKKLYY